MSTIRRKKTNEEGHGGSSWKVAYADFVTALMAFFLLLWLITMVAPEKQALVSRYFQHFSIFEKSGTSVLEGGADLMTKSKRRSMQPQDRQGEEAPVLDLYRPPQPQQQEIRNQLNAAVEAKLSQMKDQVIVDTFEQGVKIEMVDSIGSPMFPRGSAELTPSAKAVIAVIAVDINRIQDKIAIEGHTDAMSYSTNRYTNWELSTARASAARRELENNGLDPDRIIRVSGHAAMAPIIKEDPYDPRNRRISILLFTETGDADGSSPSRPASRPPSLSTKPVHSAVTAFPVVDSLRASDPLHHHP